jgi:hypothetical protein
MDSGISRGQSPTLIDERFVESSLTLEAFESTLKTARGLFHVEW